VVGSTIMGNAEWPATVLPSGRLVADGQDLDQARELVSDIFVEHRIEASRHSLRPINVSCRQFSSLALCYFDYGRALEILPEAFEDFYLLLIPVAGAAQVSSGGESQAGAVGTSMMLPADRECSMVWSGDTCKLVVQIDRRALTRRLETYFGRDLPRSPRFALEARDIEDPENPVRQSVQGLLMLANLPKGQDQALLTAAFEDTLLGSVLYAHQSDMSDAIHVGALSTACPRSVRRAEQYIESHLSEPISVDDLARAAEVSTRALFDAFRRFRETTPMAWLRQRRLHAARQALLEGGPGTMVAQVAARWGFAHQGRFAAEYSRAFGESPSQTLRQSNG